MTRRDAAASRPRARRRSTPLRRGDIIAAAIRAADRGQLGELSMRGLAQRLRVTPMALYAHVSDKDEILDEVLDHVLARSAPPPPPSNDWRSWIVEFSLQLHDLLAAEPLLLERYLQRPVGVPAALRRMEAAFAMLSDAGFDDEAILDLFGSVHTLTLGFTALEVARRGADRADFGPAFAASLAPEDYPHLRRTQPDLGGFTTRERFRIVMDRLVASHDPNTSADP